MNASPLTILEDGFSLISGVIDSETRDYLIEQLSQIETKSGINPRGGTYGVRDLLNVVPMFRQFANSELLKSLVEPILGSNAQIVRGIFFDKLPGANWKVSWHQDLTIAVRDRIDIDGYTSWSTKAGIIHVQPPIDILEKMLTVRVHLDDADELNGALKVIPKTHLRGRLSMEEIQDCKSKIPAVTCSVKRGDIMLLRPLLLHASSSSKIPTHRRVIHFEYSSATLPSNLQWYESKSLTT